MHGLVSPNWGSQRNKMAFLCPSRIRKQRRKRGRKDPTPPLPGRITGSSSIDTLVRVGLEKEDLQNGGSARPQMVVLHDFVPCVEDELAVKRGQRVTILYQENDWVYVLASDGREGFVPFVYCVPLGRSIDDLHVSTKNARPLNNSVSSVYEKTSDVFREYRDFGDHGSHMNNDAQTASSLNRNISRSMPSITTANSSSHEETDLHNSSDTPLLEDRQAKVAKVDPNRHGYSNFSFSKGPVSPLTADESSGSLLNSSSEVGTFRKAANGRFIMLFTFMAMEEGDLSVERGEFVTVLNKDDPDWFWVARSDHSEGFIPSNFLCPANGHKSTFQPTMPQTKTSESKMCKTDAPSHEDRNQKMAETPENATELIVLYDFTGQAPDEVTVTRGEWVYANMADQPEEGWLWVYVTATGKYGFIPKDFAKPPSIVRNTTTRLSNVDRTFNRQTARASTNVNNIKTRPPFDPYMSP